MVHDRQSFPPCSVPHAQQTIAVRSHNDAIPILLSIVALQNLTPVVSIRCLLTCLLIFRGDHRANHQPRRLQHRSLHRSMAYRSPTHRSLHHRRRRFPRPKGFAARSNSYSNKPPGHPQRLRPISDYVFSSSTPYLACVTAPSRATFQMPRASHRSPVSRR